MSGYAAYLNLDQLLTLQNPRSKMVTSELAFIVVHQVYELWFKLILANLQRTRDAIDSDGVRQSLNSLRDVNAIERLMIEQLTVLEHLDPCEFAEIRKRLGGSSAAESRQFAAIEAMSTCLLPGSSSRPREHDLWTAFCNLVERTGLPMPTGRNGPASGVRLGSLHRIYAMDQTHYAPLRDLCEALLDHDEGFALWRYRHCVTAFRLIGHSSGTGGSSGVQYLEERLSRRFYPELWDVRTSFSSAGVHAPARCPFRVVETDAR